jgi:hypothetical protein
MPRKPRMNVTSRFLGERSPLSTRRVPSPFPHPPPHRTPIGRLCFLGPSPKLACPPCELVHAISVAALPDAILFLDTNIFTRKMDMSVWDAFFTKRMLITPGVWKELLPWLKTPFCNKAIRDRVVAAVQSQARSKDGAKQLPNPLTPLSHEIPKMQVLFVDDHFTSHAYEYYVRLLALRKAIGPIAASLLAKKLGREPTNDEFLAEVQGRFGPRGLLIAKKGLEAAKSPNKLTDEQLVVMAVLTAITKGSEVIIITRDPDVLEQYFKLLCHMKEHYRAMLAAELYAADPSAMPFREVAVSSGGVHIARFSGSSFLEFVTTDIEFNPLPQKFHFVNVYCLLLGGEPQTMKLTSCCFCAETEMAQMLRVKAATGGLNTDKLEGRNCTIHTASLTREKHRVAVSIGKETTVPFGVLGNFGITDFTNSLFENELKPLLCFDDLGRNAPNG